MTTELQPSDSMPATMEQTTDTFVDDALEVLQSTHASELAAFIGGPAAACEMASNDGSGLSLHISKVSSKHGELSSSDAFASIAQEDEPRVLILDEDREAFATLRRASAGPFEATLLIAGSRDHRAAGGVNSVSADTLIGQAGVLMDWGVLPETLISAHASDKPASSFVCEVNGHPVLRTLVDAIPQRWEVMTGATSNTKVSDPREAALQKIEGCIPIRERQLLAAYWASVNLLLLSLGRDEPLRDCMENPARLRDRVLFKNQEYDYWLVFASLVG